MHTPTPQAMDSSTEHQQATPARVATSAVAASMGMGPQA
jgi:hypothetical protein